MKARAIIFLLIFLSFGLNAFAQNEGGEENDKEEDKEKFSDNLFFGGSLWASFGTITRVEVAPVVGYHISPRFDAGIGAKYLYYKTSSWSNSYISEDLNFSAHIFGGSVFGRYVLVKELNKYLPFTLHGRLTTHFEYEGLNLPTDFETSKSGSRFWLHNYWVGGGLQQKIGKKAYFNIFVLYNLNDNSYQLYDNPTIRIGINF
jgi:hypothetical protein